MKIIDKKIKEAVIRELEQLNFAKGSVPKVAYKYNLIARTVHHWVANYNKDKSSTNIINNITKNENGHLKVILMKIIQIEKTLKILTDKQENDYEKDNIGDSCDHTNL